jgi:thiol-disulfide isomerase/thioredoxin
VDGAACISSTDTWDEQTTRKALVAEGFEVVSIKVVDTCERVKVEHGPWGPPGRLDVKVISTADKVKLSEHLVDGKFTVIDFTAPWCGPCHVLARELATYMGQHDDMAVRVINLDSRTARGSFDLPVARQHLSFVVALPYIRVYSPKGKRLYEGGELAEALKIIEGER